MFTIDGNTETEIIEKKSRFITRLFKVTGEDEIKKIIRDIVKNEKGAVHNCHAFRIIENNSVTERKNDDGEPGGTAGAPMLAVLTGEDLVNVLAVTTRYFGGVKLGTGGLVSVYKRGVQEAVKKTKKIKFEVEAECGLVIKINQVDTAEYKLKKENIRVAGRTFGEEVIFSLRLPQDKFGKLKAIAADLQARIAGDIQ